jgi:aldose 1-epimerase
VPNAIGARISSLDEQIRFGRGYDHNWVISKADGSLITQAAVYEPETGRRLEVLSTEPGLQFYSGNFLDGSIPGKGNWVYEIHDGLTLEPQHFPTTVLKAGQTYRSTIVYRFRVSARSGTSHD